MENLKQASGEIKESVKVQVRLQIYLRQSFAL